MITDHSLRKELAVIPHKCALHGQLFVKAAHSYLACDEEYLWVINPSSKLHAKQVERVIVTGAGEQQPRRVSVKAPLAMA